MIENYIEVKDLNIVFDFNFIIEDLSFVVKKKESFVILGESGMGKSVLMKMLGTLLTPLSGDIIIDGVNITKDKKEKCNKVLEKMGFLFQYSGLFDHLDLVQNVAFEYLFIKNVKNKAFYIEKAKEMLDLVGINAFKFYLKPNEISGGMQRRVSLARTLIRNPDLILLDEPTSGLDPVMSEKINELILETKNRFNATMITITHDLHSALKISDRIAVLKDRKFIWCKSSNKFLTSNDEYIKLFISSASLNKNYDTVIS